MGGVGFENGKKLISARAEINALGVGLFSELVDLRIFLRVSVYVFITYYYYYYYYSGRSLSFKGSLRAPVLRGSWDGLTPLVSNCGHHASLTRWA